MNRILRRSINAMSSSQRQNLYRYTACDIADALLKLQVNGAGFLPDISPMPYIASNRPKPRKVIAPASTFVMAPKASPSFPVASTLHRRLPDSNIKDAGPYADYTEPDTIVVISQPPGQSCAVVGGIMAARMKQLGAQGIVVDGRVRDLGALAETALPVWSRGTSIIGSGAESKFHAKDVPIQIGETVVEAGDIVMIDPFENGVVVIPKDMVDQVLELLPKLVGADEMVIKDVEGGVSVKEAFARYRNV